MAPNAFGQEKRQRPVNCYEYTKFTEEYKDKVSLLGRGMTPIEEFVLMQEILMVTSTKQIMVVEFVLDKEGKIVGNRLCVLSSPSVFRWERTVLDTLLGYRV